MSKRIFTTVALWVGLMPALRAGEPRPSRPYSVVDVVEDVIVMQIRACNSHFRRENETIRRLLQQMTPSKPSPAIASEEKDAKLAAAMDFYRKGDYESAAKQFGHLADDPARSSLLAERARFFQAESQRLQARYPEAMRNYDRLLTDFTYGVYRDRAIAKMYEIANYWLADAWARADAERQMREAGRWLASWNLVHLDKRKPHFNQEGRALEMLEHGFYNDPLGPYADKALYLAGYGFFRRGEMREADALLTVMLINSEQAGNKCEFRDEATKLAALARANVLFRAALRRSETTGKITRVATIVNAFSRHDSVAAACLSAELWLAWGAW